MAGCATACLGTWVGLALVWLGGRVWAQPDLGRSRPGGTPQELVSALPAWCQPLPVTLQPGKPYMVFAGSRQSATAMQDGARRLLHALRQYPNTPEHPFLLYQLALHLADLDEDRAAIDACRRLASLPPDTPFLRSLQVFPDLPALQQRGSLLEARVLARSGQSAAALAMVGEQRAPGSAYERVLHAEILGLAGKTPEALALLDKAGGSGHPERNFSDTFVRLRAAVLARSLGDDTLAEAIAKPVLDRGLTSQKWPQWRASWAILDTLRRNADTQGAPGRRALRPGTYTGACQGFIEPIQVRVTVADNRLTAVSVERQREDRPWSALSVIPRRIERRQSLLVDAVTGATVTSCAIIAAVDDAVGKAAR